MQRRFHCLCGRLHGGSVVGRQGPCRSDHAREKSSSRRQGIGVDQRNQGNRAERRCLAPKRNGGGPRPLQPPRALNRCLFKHVDTLPPARVLDIRPVLFYLDTIARRFVPPTNEPPLTVHRLLSASPRFVSSKLNL